MTNTIFFKGLAVAFMALFIVSCDKDYNSIGSDIVGNEHFDFNDGESFGVKAYNQRTGVVQTNNLPVNYLGIINNTLFGKTKSNFVTQLELVTLNPTFGTGIEIDSVVLTVPYFSKKTSTESNGRGLYTLDSIRGAGELDLKVYENGYYLREYDPQTNFTAAQKYYSNEDNNFDSNKKGLPSPNADIPQLGTRLNDWIHPNTALSIEERTRQNWHFLPDAKEYVKYKVVDMVRTTDVESRLSPRMRLRLNEPFFLSKIFNAPAGKLNDNNTFKEYFRGLYFQVTDASSGQLMALDFAKGDVIIYYKQDKLPAGSGKELKEFRMTLSGTTVNLLDNQFTSTYANIIDAPVDADGAASLYIKGGEGSTAFIDILSPQEIAQLKGKIINHAYLSFTIDDNQMGTTGVVEPNRVYIYNSEKNRPIYDYFFDNSDDDNDFKKNKYLHGGMIEKVSNGLGGKKGIRYKINITEHVNNIVNKDSTNVRLGLVVTENINLSGSSYLKTPIASPKKFDRVPVNSVMNPLGTVLYGTNSSVPTDKKVQFKVYYTKPN